MAVNINGDTGIDKVQPGSVDGVDLTDGSVTEGKIGTGAVTSAKLANDISVPGTVTATSFVGSGASLTGIAGGFSNMEVFNSPGTWTNPGNVQKVKVTIQAGGGGGAGGYLVPNAQEYAGSGGGGGGGAIKIISSPTPISPVAVTVGSGGNPGGYPANGGAGGTSSFGAYCSATGGAGGNRELAPTYAAGGEGGAGSSGDLNFGGSRGGPAVRAYGASGYADLAGGNSFMGQGGVVNASTNGWGSGPGTQPGLSYGGGGSGATGQYWSPTIPTAANTSGAGAAGVVIVEY